VTLQENYAPDEQAIANATTDCHIIYYTGASDAPIVDFISKVSARGVLIVSDNVELAQFGGHFFMVENEESGIDLKFNFDAIKHSNLSAKAQLLSMSQEVEK